MLEKLSALRTVAEQDIAAAASLEDIKELRVKYLGKKGEITLISKQLGTVSAEERPKLGQAVNVLRTFVEQELNNKEKALANAALEYKLANEKLDISLPGRSFESGSLHPLT
ncbi:MAG: phenylalanine--tRNA ligase subunit alpha, partial [Firmicutes bacterium]|nr:phenylalanine--tRNA ligase subunit alpha [Bacillota bacterium]